MGNISKWPLSSRIKYLCSLFPQQFSSMFNVLQRKYQEAFENMKDQIYFMQTETPEYKMNKQAGVATSKVWGHSLFYLDGLSVGEFLTTLTFVYKGEKKVLRGTIRKILWDYNRATKFFLKKLPCRRIHNTQLPSSAFLRLKDVLIPRSRKDKRISQEKATGSLVCI